MRMQSTKSRLWVKNKINNNKNIQEKKGVRKHHRLKENSRQSVTGRLWALSGL